MTRTHTLINGIDAGHVPVDDRGLHYGDGLFETLKLQAGKLCYWPQHFARLQASAETLKLKLPAREVFEQDFRTLIGDSNLGEAVIKLIVTRGSGQRGYAFDASEPCRRITSISPMPPGLAQHAAQGIRATVCRHRLASQPALAGIKHLNRLDNVLARNELHKDCQEGVMLSRHGLVVEGCSSNLFFCRDGQWYSPKIDEAGVDGVVRRQLLELLEQQSRPVVIGEFSLQDLQQAEEMFFCNSLIGLWPVRQLDDKLFDSLEQSRQLAGDLTQHEQRHAIHPQD